MFFQYLLSLKHSVFIKDELSIFNMSLKKVLEYIYNGAYNELLEPNQDVFRKKSEIEEVMKKS